ncbi:MAG: molybdopterin-dependent oxidoreductase [Deltaproteobacteria bacterium]|nr:molybdopterin-dependent oxidoreductase [Deltaproteobacteria bacterium]
MGTNREVIRTTCFLCHGGCTLLAHVKGGKLVKLVGDPQGPLNQGSICEKGSAAKQYLYSPYRLKYPLKRSGERGCGRWKRITWKEAINITASRLTEIKRDYGGESIAYAWGTSRIVHSYPRMNFYNGVLGSPNGIGIGHICLTKTRMPVVSMTLGPIPGLAGLGIMRDFDRSNCIVAWGDTLIDSRNDGMGGVGKRLMKCLRRGCKLIVIDPVFTRAASKADIWLPIRPGTDLALALSWINVIISEQLYDEDFIKRWTNAPFLVRDDVKRLLRKSDILRGGSPDEYIVWDEASCRPKSWNATHLSYEDKAVVPALYGSYRVFLWDGTEIECRPVWELMREIASEWHPEKAAKVTWLPADRIRESARLYAKTRPACIEWGVSMSQCSRSTATNQAILHLKAITGNLDAPGGNAFWHVPGYRMPHTPLSSEQEEKRITSHYLFSHSSSTPRPSAHQPDVWRAAATGKPYPIRALYGETSNPLVNHEKPDKYVMQALKKIDFIVWTDITMTPSNEWADILLPVSTPLERDWVHAAFDRGIFAGQAVVPPFGESRSDFYVWRDLCHGMGFEDMWPWKTERDLCDWKLRPLGMTFEELTETCFYPAPEIWAKHEKGLLRPDKRPGFPTDSGKLEFYASKLENTGIQPLPVFSYPPESYETTPSLSRDYPLILITGSRELNFPYFHSQYHYVPWLRERQPYPVVLVHPRTARKYGIGDGNWSWIETRRGRARFKAVVTRRIHPKVVSACHAWWYPELPGPEHGVFESNVNVLVDPHGPTDPATGTPELRGLLCKVYRAEGPPPGVKDSAVGQQHQTIWDVH